ncbi:hypothetical protein [Streptomyces sp. TP-A0356]|uniref:hypothetical protein n=1 Tax=Streptomyces sp. TP-A0356 TaxID=1359208 RepID=UPI0006E3607D|nr:hypothetical protein [Streptomyces sp. TP-A0356]
MATGSTDTPASLYSPASLGLGIASTVAAVFSGYIGLAIPLLAGSLAVTFALLGLAGKINRKQCVIGLIGGAVGVLYPVSLIVALSV